MYHHSHQNYSHLCIAFKGLFTEPSKTNSRLLLSLNALFNWILDARKLTKAEAGPTYLSRSTSKRRLTLIVLSHSTPMKVLPTMVGASFIGHSKSIIKRRLTLTASLNCTQNWHGVTSNMVGRVLISKSTKRPLLTLNALSNSTPTILLLIAV